jgi:hypothetical protein
MTDHAQRDRRGQGVRHYTVRPIDVSASTAAGFDSFSMPQSFQLQHLLDTRGKQPTRSQA